MYTLLRRTKPSENIPLSATKVDNAGDNANPARRPPVKSHLGRFNMHISIHKAFLNNHASSLYTLAWQRWLYCAPKHCSPLGNGRSQCKPRRWRCRWQCWVRCASRFCKIREAGDKRNLIIDYRSNKEKRCLKGLSHAYRRRIINATVPYSGRQTKWQSGQGYCKLPVSKTMSTMYSEMR